MITPETIGGVLACFLLCVVAPPISGLVVNAAACIKISSEQLINSIASVTVMCILLHYFNSEPGNQARIPFINRNFGSLNIFKQKVVVKWPEDWTASNTKVVRFLLQTIDDVRAEIRCLGETITHTLLYEQGELQVIFPARRSGEYRVTLWVGGREVRSSPWVRYVLPRAPHPPSCKVIGAWGAGRGLVVQSGGPSQSLFQIRDEFGNPVNCSREDCENVKIEITSASSSSTSSSLSSPSSSSIASTPTTSVTMSPGVSEISLSAQFPQECVGSHPLLVKYNGLVVARVQILVVSSSTITDIKERILREASSYAWNSYYTMNLTKLAGCVQSKPRTVYVYMKEKQVVVKEYILKFIPRKIISFRVNPKVTLSVSVDNSRVLISQSDIYGADTVLAGEPALRLAAAYYLILSRRMGETETFSEKRDHFYAALNKHHAEKCHKHVRIPLVIQRANIFESTFRATRYYLESDWARLFDIKFDGEAGQDQGGLRREWMELITRFMFDAKNGMFIPLEENGPGLQPNPFPPNHIKLKHYRLAGKLVGKCIYESSTGKTYRMNLNAQLAKSFLTQIIGLDVPFTMLATDAPLLFESKVKYILENPVEELELAFTQEESRGGSRFTVDLCPGGAFKNVTERNKQEYIQQMSRYLMVDRISKQMEAFNEGVQTLVPPELLTLWDEYELELLLCGIRQYNLDQLKDNHAIVGVQTFRFSRILKWFWESLSHFSNEDMARFVQFVTGSSLLPPGGWSELSPILQISLGGEKGSLPTSHTCFNLLVLPDAENYQELERVLILALREGSEGFLLA